MLVQFADGRPSCDVTMTSDVSRVHVSCDVRVNASSINLPLESLEVRPLVVAASPECLSDFSERKSGRGPLFVVSVTIMNSTDVDCSFVNLTFNSTVLAGDNLISTIDDRQPAYGFSLPTTNRGKSTFSVTLHVTLSWWCSGWVSDS